MASNCIIIIYADVFDDGGLNTVFLENISLADPTVMIVRPTEKLVLEVKAEGRYQRIFWRRNAKPLSSNMPQNPQEFSNHYEIFVLGETTEDDLGLYEVSILLYDAIEQRQPAGINFIVISPCELFPISLCL